MATVIRLMRTGEHAACDRILRALPDWFGIEEAIVSYVRDLQSMETWIAEVDGEWTMKYFSKRGNRIFLQAANKKYAPFFPNEKLSIGGVVIANVRKYK